jgi:hypothetical protein
MTVIYRTNKADWADTALAKKELAFYLRNNNKGQFDSAIKKEEDIIRSFTTEPKLKEAA